MDNIEKKAELINVKAKWISLVDKAANLKEFAIIKSENQFAVENEILKADYDKQIVTAVVYTPGELDAHGDYMTSDEIEKAAHYFLSNKGDVDLQHNYEVAPNVNIVESWVTKQDGVIGSQDIKKGTWMASMKVENELIWKAIKDGNITGFSMGGTGQRIKKEIKREEEMTVEDIKKAMSEIMEAENKNEVIKDLTGKIEELEKSMGTENEEIKKMKETIEKMDEVIRAMDNKVEKKASDYTEDELFEAIGKAANELVKGGVKELEIGEILEKADATTTSHASGVKHAYLTMILRRIQDSNPIMTDVNFMTISDNSLFVPREMIGLPETGWIGETGDRVDTDPTLIDDVTIELHQLYALPVVTNKLLGTNFVQFGQFLMMRVQDALNKTISDAILYGTGTLQPNGILLNTTVAAALVTWTDESDSDPIVDLVDAIREDYANVGKFYMNRLTWNAVKKLKNSEGDYRLVELADATAKILLGRPVVIVDSMPNIATATTGDAVILFGDVNSGYMGIKNDRVAIQLEDRVTKKGFTKYYSEICLGGDVVLPEAFSGLKKA